jgi:hypothetical protein
MSFFLHLSSQHIFPRLCHHGWIFWWGCCLCVVHGWAPHLCSSYNRSCMGFCNEGANGFHLYKSHLVFWWPHDMKVFRLYPLHGYTNLKLMLVAILFVSKFTRSYVRMNDLKRLTLLKPFFPWWNGWQCIMWLQWLFNMVSPSCIWMWNSCF